MEYLYPVSIPSVPVANAVQHFPIHRIYCVGQNYADHALEMGVDPRKEAPVFFTKPPDAITSSGSKIPFPTRTENLHYEVELVLAIAREANAVTEADAKDCLFGYAVGIDLTKRDLQAQAKKAGRPWDVAKGFEQSAPISAVHPIAETGYLERAEISLSLNGEVRQQSDIANMIWNPGEIIAELSTYFHLKPGDLIFTGTPAGVGPISPGDELVGSISGVDQVTVSFI